MKRSLVGIGAVLRLTDGYCEITRVLPGGPASRDKREIRLRAGDRIIAVGQGDDPLVDVSHWPLSKTVNIIRGKKGTTVVLKVIPADDPTGNNTKLVDITRDKVQLEDGIATASTKFAKDSDGIVRKLGIIDLPGFYADFRAMQRGDKNYKSASRDIRKLLRELKEKEVDGVLIDLRNNGGGSLVEAVLTTGLFIEAGPTVQVKRGNSVSVLPDRDPGIAYDGPLVILCSRLTASASEIVAGALQDYGRALVVGDKKTHGKGSVQSMVPLGDDEKLGSIKITNALFFRISGSSTQLKGVTPDVAIPSSLDTMDIGEDHLNNPLPWQMIRPVRFPHFSDLGVLVPRLNDKADARRTASEDFISYTNLLARFDAVDNPEKMPLDLDTRLTMARKRKALVDERDKLLGEGNDRKDLIEAEGLAVLADLVPVFPDYTRRFKDTAKHKDDIPDAVRKEVLSRIKDLQHEDAGVRARAKQQLKQLGSDAVPFLEDYRNSEDPELRMTILELLAP